MWIEYLSQIRQAEGLCNQERPAAPASSSDDADTPPSSADDQSNTPPDTALGHVSGQSPESPVPSSARPELDSHTARNLQSAGFLKFPLYAELIPVIEDLQAISQSRKGVLSNEDLRRDALSWAGHLCSVQNSLLHGQFKTATDILERRVGMHSLPEQLIDVDRRIALATADDADMTKELDELENDITNAVENKKQNSGRAKARGDSNTGRTAGVVMPDPDVKELQERKPDVVRRLTRVRDAYKQLVALREVVVDLERYLRNISKALKRIRTIVKPPGPDGGAAMDATMGKITALYTTSQDAACHAEHIVLCDAHWQFAWVLMATATRYMESDNRAEASVMYYRLQEWVVQYRLATHHSISTMFEDDRRFLDKARQADLCNQSGTLKSMTTFIMQDSGIKVLHELDDPVGRALQKSEGEKNPRNNLLCEFVHPRCAEATQGRDFTVGWNTKCHSPPSPLFALFAS